MWVSVCCLAWASSSQWCPCLACTLSTMVSCGLFSPSYCGEQYQKPRSRVFSDALQSILNNKPLPQMAPDWTLSNMLRLLWVSSPTVACCGEIMTFRVKSCTVFSVYSSCALLLLPALPAGLLFLRGCWPAHSRVTWRQWTLIPLLGILELSSCFILSLHCALSPASL